MFKFAVRIILMKNKQYMSDVDSSKEVSQMTELGKLVAQYWEPEFEVINMFLTTEASPTGAERIFLISV